MNTIELAARDLCKALRSEIRMGSDARVDYYLRSLELALSAESSLRTVRRIDTVTAFCVGLALGAFAGIISVMFII